MIVTEAQIIAGLVIKATGQKSTNSCVTMGRISNQYPALLSFPPELGGFIGWEGTFSVSSNDVATVNLTTGIGTNFAGSPDFTGLRGLDWEGVPISVRPYLRAVMVENSSNTELTIFGSGIVGSVKIAAGCTFLLASPRAAMLANVPQILRFSRLGAAMQPVKITALLEASD